MADNQPPGFPNNREEIVEPSGARIGWVYETDTGRWRFVINRELDLNAKHSFGTKENASRAAVGVWRALIARR